MHTLHGVVLGYSDGTTIIQARGFAALTGLSWRLKNDALLAEPYRRGPPSVTTGGGFPFKVLQVTTNMHDGSLRQMVGEMDGFWIAACYIKQQLLVSVVIEKDPDPDEKEVTAPTDIAKSEAKESASIQGKAIGPNGGTEHSSGDGEQNGPTSDKGKNDGTEAATENPRTPSPASSANTQSTEPLSPRTADYWAGKNQPPVKMISHDNEPSKIQILKWKAEGMAAVLKKDLKDFKMPTGAG